MKTVILYRPNSDHARRVEEFIHEYNRGYTNVRLETLNIDSREGAALASLYDIMNYPAIMVLRDDGSPSMIWQGDQLPLMDEVESYLQTA
jgi:hypothetical protein